MNTSDILSAEERAALRNAFMAMVVAGVTLTVPAHAMDAEDMAATAAVTDGLSTAAVVAAGAVESNPVVNSIGLGPITLVKVALPYAVRDADPEVRKVVLVSATGTYTFATVANLLLWLVPGIGEARFVAAVAAGFWAGDRAADKVGAEQAQVVALAKE